MQLYSSSFFKLFAAALFLVAFGALVVRVTPKPEAAPEASRAAWTYLRETPLRGKGAIALEGTSSTRQSLIKVIGKEIRLLVEEAEITDRKKLTASLQAQAVRKIQIAGREGYLVPVADIAGGSGLLFVGESTALLFQDVNAAQWPRALLPDVLSYLTTVQVP